MITRDEAKNAVVATSIEYHDREDRDTKHKWLEALDIFRRLREPECPICEDRGRVWAGRDGATKRCSCVIWGVWLTLREGHVSEVYGTTPHRWAEEGLKKKFKPATARRIAAMYNDGAANPKEEAEWHWHAEVRRFDSDE